MSTHHALAEVGFVAKWLAPRWKAIAGFLVPLASGLSALAATGDLDAAHVLGLLGISLGTGGVVHTVPNRPIISTILDDAAGSGSAASDVVVSAVQQAATQSDDSPGG